MEGASEAAWSRRPSFLERLGDAQALRGGDDGPVTGPFRFHVCTMSWDRTGDASDGP